MAESDRNIGVVERLCAVGQRPTGTDAERRAAGWLAEQLRGDGRAVAIEPTYVHPQWATVQMLHALVAVAASLLVTVAPAVAFALILLTSLSLYLDLAGRAYLLRRLLFRRASQNVISPRIEEEPRDRVILCAHYDAPRTGAAYNGWAIGAYALFERLWPTKTSPQAALFWLVALLVPPLGLRMAGLEGSWLAALQLPQTMGLILAAFMLGEIALSPPSPGANANASGVAGVLAAARRLASEQPQALGVHVLLCGGGESTREGLRSFLRANRKRLPRDRTWFVALESVGRGDPRYVPRELPVLGQPLDPTLVELVEALVADAPQITELDPGPAGAAGLAAYYGYPAVALTCREGDERFPADHHTPADTPEKLSAESIAASAELAAELVQLLDRQLQRQRRPENEEAALA